MQLASVILRKPRCARGASTTLVQRLTGGLSRARHEAVDTRGPKLSRPSPSPTWRHFVEMIVAILIGMAALGVPFRAILASVGSTWGETVLRFAEIVCRHDVQHGGDGRVDAFPRTRPAGIGGDDAASPMRGLDRPRATPARTDSCTRAEVGRRIRRPLSVVGVRHRLAVPMPPAFAP